jgi:hypothetical protein
MTATFSPFKTIFAGFALLTTCASVHAQGVPIIDLSNLTNAISRLEEMGRDALTQGKKLTGRTRLSELEEEQLDAYERFLQDTTGTTDLSPFEDGGDDFASADETYPIVEDNADAARLFGEDQDVEAMIIATAQKYQRHPGVAAAGLNPTTWRILFQSLIKQESGFNNAAVSSAGAMGFCQLMPLTAKGLGVDPKDPWQNLDGGARYILTQLQEFGRIDYALGAYNAGPGRIRQYGGVPPFEETQNYVRSIQAIYQGYLSEITGIDMTGSLNGFDGASAAWGNWADASNGYAGYMAGQVDASMGRTAALLRSGKPADAKESVDQNTYLIAERGRLMALMLRQRAAQVKVEAAAGMTRAAEDLEMASFWRYTDASE